MANPLRKTMVYLGLADEDYEYEQAPAAPAAPVAAARADADPRPGDPAAPRIALGRSGHERDPHRAPAGVQGRSGHRRALPRGHPGDHQPLADERARRTTAGGLRQRARRSACTARSSASPRKVFLLSPAARRGERRPRRSRGRRRRILLHPVVFDGDRRLGRRHHRLHRAADLLVVHAGAAGARPRPPLLRAAGAAGPGLVVAEAVFALTDPPIKLVRRVVPPIRVGNVALDLAWTIVAFARAHPDVDRGRIQVAADLASTVVRPTWGTATRWIGCGQA